MVSLAKVGDENNVEFYGACGVENCADCLPRYDLDNNPVGRGCGCEGGCEREADSASRLCSSCERDGCAPYAVSS